MVCRAWTPSSWWRAAAACPNGKCTTRCCRKNDGDYPMLNRFRLPAAMLLASALCPAQDYVDTVVERARKEFDVPGIAVAIVKDGSVVLAKGYGVRKQGESAPVTAQ